MSVPFLTGSVAVNEAMLKKRHSMRLTRPPGASGRSVMSLERLVDSEVHAGMQALNRQVTTFSLPLLSKPPFSYPLLVNHPSQYPLLVNPPSHTPF